MSDYALIVGCNYEGTGNRLAGPEVDASNVAYFLKDIVKFNPDGIMLLTGRRVTKKNIRDRLRWIASVAKPGDRVWFSFSGHGTQVASRNAKREVDGKNEALCMVTIDNWTEEDYYTDDEFFEDVALFAPGVKVYAENDSCHSGTFTKSLQKPGLVKVAKRIIAPPDMQWRLMIAKEKGLKKKSVSGFWSKQLDIGYISGCKENELSADTQDDTGKPGGALTIGLLKIWRDGGLKLPLTKVAEQLRRDLKIYDQQPQAEGNFASKPLFG